MGQAPSADNYQLGKGVIYFNQKVGANLQGFLDLGNAPNFSFNMSLEKLEHFSSRGGLKAKDQSVISQITPGISFTLDEINEENLALLTMGTVTNVSQSGDTITDETHTVRALGTRIQLAERGISAVTVGDDATPTITYVEGAYDPNATPGTGANYQINTSLKDDVIGRILIHADQSLAAQQIAVDQTIYVDYTSAAVDYVRIDSFTNTQIEGILHFVSDNPIGGDQELKIWRVSLTPEGDTSMIGDDWSTLAFTGEVLKVEGSDWDGVDHSASPYMEIIIP